jgi:tousled-like kinase
MDMLGKGGFSEVYRAFDMKALCEVAIKIHQLNSQWNEAKKQSYVRHAVREYNIHKSLKHRRVVALTDIFEIDNNTFATVLELCRGGDLEGHLREHSTLPEKEAKAIVVQILHGLAYLNDPERRIIHYDLKPANILFDGFGEVKITVGMRNPLHHRVTKQIDRCLSFLLNDTEKEANDQHMSTKTNNMTKKRSCVK